MPSLHESITIERVEEACRESMFGMEYPGFCLECGADADGVEPDAVGYVCHECGAHAVMGAKYVAMHMV